jgi:hypothetical protein
LEISDTAGLETCATSTARRQAKAARGNKTLPDVKAKSQTHWFFMVSPNQIPTASLNRMTALNGNDSRQVKRLALFPLFPLVHVVHLAVRAVCI